MKQEYQHKQEITLSDFELYLLGYRLTTAEIIYRLPDHPDLLQTFLWQKMDLDPRFPQLFRFLHFWERNIEGQLYHVKVVQSEQVELPNITVVDQEIQYEGGGLKLLSKKPKTTRILN